jgi:hypothetical protein
MKFVDNHIKIKTNWFELNSIISKIGCDALLMYLMLHKYSIKNQDQCTFATSIYQLKKATGFTMDYTYQLIKLLIRYGVIKCNVRWDRHEDNDFMLVAALDEPKTTRQLDKYGKPYDHPDTDDDKYISVDLRLMQYYIDNGLDGREIALYCLIRKLSNNTEKKCWMIINTMATILNLSDDKIHKMVKQMNRMKLLASNLRKVGKKIVKGKEVPRYRYEHHIFPNYSTLDKFRNSWLKDVIEKNIKKWDKLDVRKSKGKDKILEIEDQSTDINEDVLYLPDYEEIEIPDLEDVTDEDYAFGIF